MAERFLAQPWRLHALALGFLAVVLAVRFAGGVFDAAPRPDEQVYVDAAAEVLAGASPYAAPDFLYPPPFAYAAAASIRWLGLGTTLAVGRAVNLLGAAWLLWLAVGCLGLSNRWRLALAAVVGCLSPGMAVALRWGNIGPAVGAAVLVGLLAWRSRPIASGLLLGLAGVAKPLTPVALVALGAHRPASRSEGSARLSSLLAPHRLAALVGLASGALVALATPYLGDYLATSAGRPDQPRNLSLHRLLGSLGVELDSLTVVVLAACVAVVWVRLRPLSRFELLAVGTATTLLAVPLVWSHTLLVTLPLQGLALQAAWERFARRDATTTPTFGLPPTRARRYELAWVALACLALLASDGADGPDRDTLAWLRTLFAGMAASIPSGLAAYVIWTGRVAARTTNRTES